MTFNPANPPNAESPALFPAENRTNMLRLQTLFGQDHQFNNSAATNDGWHKIVHWVEQSGLIDPLDPTLAAPSNAGGPCITWEQQDTYNVPRPWFRLPNGGNVISMMGFSEIRVDNFSVNTVPQVLIVPPDNTYGDIYFTTALGGIGRGSYWKQTNCYAQAIVTKFSPSVNAGAIVYFSNNNVILPSPNLYVFRETGTLLTSFRIIYRYI